MAHHDPAASALRPWPDRKSTRLNSSHSQISYAVFCLKKKNIHEGQLRSSVHYVVEREPVLDDTGRSIEPDCTGEALQDAPIDPVGDGQLPRVRGQIKR